MHGFFSIAIILIAYALTFTFTASVRRVLMKRALLDHPNERSSHSVPVPRGGGWAVIILLLPAMLLMAMLQKSLVAHAGLIIGVVLLMIISWLDDRKGVSAARRLSMHILAACLGSLAFPPDQMIFGGMLPFWLDRVLMIIGWAWFMNLYNFMDGIDGITGVETISIATGVSLVMTAALIDNPFADMLTLLLTGAGLGFLAFNWHPAKIFLGDVGSVPLGYLCGFLLISLAVKGHLAPALILPLYYLADSGITLAKRALRREKIWQAHRQHFYQYAALGIGNHDEVVVAIGFTNAALIAAALVAVNWPAIGFGLGLVIVAVLLKILHGMSDE